MTRQDMIATLRDLMTGRLREVPASWRVAEGPEDGLAIGVEGDRFDVAVWHSSADRDPLDAVFGGMTEVQRLDLARSIDDAEDEDERLGPVSPDDLRRSLDEAKARGLARWKARQSSPAE